MVRETANVTRERAWGDVVKAAADCHGKSKVSSLGCSKPMKIIKGLADIFSAVKADSRSGGGVEIRLEAHDKSSRNSCKHGVVVIDLRVYEESNQQLADVKRERMMNTAQLSQNSVKHRNMVRLTSLPS